jgi:hypothetical protein
LASPSGARAQVLVHPIGWHARIWSLLFRALLWYDSAHNVFQKLSLRLDTFG